MFRARNQALLFLSLVFVSVYASAQSSGFVENFEQRSKKLEKILIQSENPEAASNAILSEASSYRSAVFQLQAMGRVLSGLNEEFNFLRFEFKKLEDGIGEHKKWVEIGNLEKQTEAAQKFTHLLTIEGWLGQSGKFMSLKNNFSQALSRHKITESFVARYWLAEARKIQEKKYDFSQLEGKVGLHEFKRDLRWILLEMMVFPNVVGLDKKSENCPLSKKYVDYAIAGLELKYAKFVSADEAKSHLAISACLVSTLAHLVDDIDAFKTDSEKFLKDHADNRVPEEIKEKALELYKLFRKSKVMDLLAGAIEAST